jgi:hypothetical protein
LDAERTIRTAPWLLLLIVVVTALFAVGALTTVQDAGWGLAAIGLVALALLGLIALFESVSARIVLSDDGIRVVSFWITRVYAAAEIGSVRWEGGSGVALKLASGAWVKLPELGRDSQSIVNIIRAWLERAGA